ncbi:MAG: hypothetical protein IJW14_01365 [Oscillospiraceae bacterium]|nr:hypothetical protein [Oscillospiraceae bacterium]
MSEFTIGIAERRIRICAMYDYAQEFCKKYLTEGEPDFTVTILPEDIEFERAKSAREDEVEGIPTRQYSPGYLETLAIYRKIVEKMLDYNAFLFHGSGISVDGEGYLFTAKSGTGKSTHAWFWRMEFGDRFVTVNDDKPLLLVKEEKVILCGTPWDGKHRFSTNIMVPLKAIVLLERGEENVIDPVDVATALPMLVQQTYRPAGPVALSKTLKLIESMTKKVGLYRLKCNKKPSAARVAYDGMNRKDN